MGRVTKKKKKTKNRNGKLSPAEEKEVKRRADAIKRDNPDISKERSFKIATGSVKKSRSNKKRKS